MLRLQAVISCNMMPLRLATANIIPIIVRFCRMLRFARKSISSPVPAPVQRPATAATKPRPPEIYSSVITTDAAQLGIKPKIAAITG